MAYGVYSDRGYREHILERNKNTNKTEVFTQEDQTFTGRKTFLSGVTTSDLEVQTVEVSESLKVKGKDITVIDYLPNDVSKENKLTTKDFVNSSIATNTANFLGTFNTLEEIEALTDVTNNDYAFWKTTDTLGSVVFKRYKYIADEQLWKFEYDLNNSSFTAEQWEAINSGITAELVAKIGDGSAIVPSITKAEYEEIPNKKDGQIREITDAPDRLVPFATLNDTLMTATNVLSALKINELFGYELGQNENGNYLKCANGLLVCWGKAKDIPTNPNTKTVILPMEYKDTDFSVIITSNSNYYASPEANNTCEIISNNELKVSSGSHITSTYSWCTIGFWK